MLETLEFVLALVLTFVGLHALIFFHELGHLMTGELFHIAVQKVQVGIGPRLCGFEIANVKWEWRLLPIVGFVLFRPRPADCRPEESPENYFDSTPKWMRLLTIAAGPLASAVVAAVLFSCSVLFFPQRFPINPLIIKAIVPSSRAELAGLRVGDLLFASNSESGEFLELDDDYEPLKASGAHIYAMRKASGDQSRYILLRGNFNPLNLQGVEYGPTFPLVYLPRVGGSVIGWKQTPASSSLGVVVNHIRRMLMGPGAAFSSFAWTSLAIALGNLLPFFPLDGGRLLTITAEGFVPEAILLIIRLSSLAFVVGFILSFEFAGTPKDISRLAEGLINHQTKAVQGLPPKTIP